MGNTEWADPARGEEEKAVVGSVGGGDHGVVRVERLAQRQRMQTALHPYVITVYSRGYAICSGLPKFGAAREMGHEEQRP